MLIENPMERRCVALLILSDHYEELSWQAGSFLGQICACHERPLTEKQANWFDKLVERAGLAPNGGAA